MSKELEVLERTSSEFIDGYPTGNVNVGMTWEEHSAIKQALQRLEAIDNSNPSEALKWLEKYRLTILFNTSIVENALIKAQKQEKALNAIIKKNVNIWRFKVETNIDYKKYKSNNILYHDVYNGNLLTEGEFNSIMEVVKCLKS